MERWLALLTERRLRRGVFRSTREPGQAIERYLARHNEESKSFIWTKSADEMLQALAWTCQRINDSGHSRRANDGRVPGRPGPHPGPAASSNP